MKKGIFLLFTLTFVTFNSLFAQYDVLEKQGFYGTDNSLAHGGPNTYDRQYERRDDKNYNPNYANNYQNNDRRDDKHYHADRCHVRGERNNYDTNSRTANRQASLVIRDFDVDRFRKNEVELEFEVRGPKFLTYKTQWRGTTLLVMFDYPYTRTNDNKCSEVKIPIGRLSKDINYNVIAVDLTSNMEIGRYSIN